MKNKALIKIYDNKLKKWCYTFVNLKKDDDLSIISYKELLKRYETKS